MDCKYLCISEEIYEISKVERSSQYLARKTSFYLILLVRCYYSTIILK